MITGITNENEENKRIVILRFAEWQETCMYATTPKGVYVDEAHKIKLEKIYQIERLFLVYKNDEDYKTTKA